MVELLFIDRENGALAELQARLAGSGFGCASASPGNGLIKRIADRPPDLVLLEIGCLPGTMALEELVRSIKETRQLPVIALANGAGIDLDTSLQVDDFLLSPYDAPELELRIKRLLRRNGKRDDNKLMRCGDLAIDQDSCEVTLGGAKVMLTFREYELLRFLVSNAGRVFNRDRLLNEVWGYDYFGGDRTVDVHIRRLRSKIEVAGRVFIETVRNIGYRFVTGH